MRMKDMRTSKKLDIDWAAIETDFRDGDMSIRDLARWHRVSEAAVRKRAKAGGWTRLAEAPKAPVKKREISVTYSVPMTPVTVETTDPEAIIGRGQNLVLRMLDELDATTSRVGELGMLIDEATDADESPRRNEAMMKAVSLPSRAATLKALATAVKTLAETATAAPKGKKALRQETAEKSSSAGRFAVPQVPRALQ